MKPSVRDYRLRINDFLGEYSYNHDLIKAVNRPKIFAIESTNWCQLQCVMCPRTHMKRRMGEMDINLFKKIVDRNANYTTFLWLHDFGEPLLHSNIGQLIRYVKKKEISVGISTNAVSLDEKNGRELITSGLDYLRIAFDAPNKEIYEIVRRNAKFDVVMDNILNFISLKSSMNSKSPFISLSIIEMMETKDHLSSFKTFFEGKVDEVLVTPFDTWDGSLESINKLAPYEVKAENHREKCPWLWDRVVVLWDGRVVPCCRDYDAKYVLGDLNHQSLKEIWNGREMQHLRKMQIDGRRNEVDLCERCRIFGGPPDRIFPVKWILNRVRARILR